jgi:hypothetical protein
VGGQVFDNAVLRGLEFKQGMAELLFGVLGFDFVQLVI